MVPYSHGPVPGSGALGESSPERVGPRRRGLARDPFLARVAVMLGGEALAPVRTRLTKPGDVLAEPGMPLHAVCAILSGRLGIFRTDPLGVRPRLREVLGPGERAGDAQVLDDRFAPADFGIQCLEGGLVAVIDADLYWQWCQQTAIAMSVLRELTEQARARERLRSSWLELDVTARMAALLLDLHERFGSAAAAGSLPLIAHGLSQSQLGDLIGARRETVNRVNRLLATEGLVEHGPRGTVLRDIKGLEARAGRATTPQPRDHRAVS